MPFSATTCREEAAASSSDDGKADEPEGEGDERASMGFWEDEARLSSLESSTRMKEELVDRSLESSGVFGGERV